MAWSDVLNNYRKKPKKWNNPILRSCENYLYAFAAINSYGDNPYLLWAGVNAHSNIKRLNIPWSSPYSGEAHSAGLEGVADAKTGKNWRLECENCH